MQADLEDFYQVLNSTNVDIEEVYYQREIVRLRVGTNAYESITEYEAALNAYAAKIDAMKVSIARRRILCREDLTEEQRAIIVELLDKEAKGLWT
jgi:hypothetical protein